jgi:nitronate monooxygenase
MISLQRLVDVALPILQAPMAGVPGSALAAAVCNAGALGPLPCAMLGADALRDELKAIEEQTGHPCRVNYHLASGCKEIPAAQLTLELAAGC